MDISSLPKDVILLLALELNYPDIISLCQTSSRFNQLVCQSDSFWRNKMLRDYPDGYPNYEKLNLEHKSLKETYYLLYSLSKVKEGLKCKENIWELYQAKKLDLTYRGIQGIPKEIGNLNNLLTLNLNNNNIKEIPKEIGKLTNLQGLYLSNNKIERLPKEIGNLNNLQSLSLYSNKLQELPKEIGNLTNLRVLSFSNNKIERLPKEIDNLNNLLTLYLSENNIKEIPKESRHLRILI